ncbi:hypothetical protein [Kangiella sediminilitoris]|uniref:Uncharacterized protein n=1 Tax=Kangiella sediminilitoris TaxID=1144748 RepID=A0A1B3BC09_9GAMM|nr:hypothetical protein [Kangiella sediminilitoris]AOE50313.1 hypothetical protein KS2013_1603 [Kangiella sediminilitoris]
MDSAKTKEIYSSIKKDSAFECGCEYCRNFMAQMPNCFPQEVISFFEQCGIDPLKDAEVYEIGPISEDSNLHLYGGEYYFISEKHPKVDEDKLPSGFQFTINNSSACEPEEFRKSENVKHLHFLFPIPWVLDESP